MDEREIELREDFETSKQRSIAVREWGYTALIWSGVCAATTLTVVLIIMAVYLVPAISAWKRANDVTTKNWQEAAPVATQAVADIGESARHLKGVLANVEVITDDGKQLMSKANTQLVPGVLDSMRVTIQKSGRAMDVTTTRLDEFIKHTDERFNGEQGLMAAVTDTARAFNTSIDSVDKAIVEITSKGVLALDDVHKILSSPDYAIALKEIAETTKNTNKITGHLVGVSAELEKMSKNFTIASEKVPEIAESLNKIAKTSSRYQKALLLATIIGTLAKAFLP